jgi:hypothetical protein
MAGTRQDPRSFSDRQTGIAMLLRGRQLDARSDRAALDGRALDRGGRVPHSEAHQHLPDGPSHLPRMGWCSPGRVLPFVCAEQAVMCKALTPRGRSRVPVRSRLRAVVPLDV